MKIRKIHNILILCSVVVVSCHWGKGSNDEGVQDTDVTVSRYDQLLNEYVEYNSFLALQKMNTHYLSETKYLIEDILELGPVDDAHTSTKLKAFYSDSTLRVLSRDALAKFKDMSGLEKDLTRGFRNLKKEIPSVKIPRVYSQLSALNESVVVGDSVLGFSIDKYMGKDYPLYKQFYYDYQCSSMVPDRIVPDCFMFYLLSQYPLSEKDTHSLLECMMHKGKIHYLIKEILDYDSYAQEMGYSGEEDEWCTQNRKQIWEYITRNGHLNTNDPMVIRKYMASAPYTAYFGDGSPPMLGVWMGTQIIDSYLKNNKDVSIEELMKDTDYRRMWTNAKFKP